MLVRTTWPSQPVVYSIPAGERRSPSASIMSPRLLTRTTMPYSSSTPMTPITLRTPSPPPGIPPSGTAARQWSRHPAAVDHPQIAIAGTNIYVTYLDNGIKLTKSTDGGKTWSAPTTLDRHILLAFDRSVREQLPSFLLQQRRPGGSGTTSRLPTEHRLQNEIGIRRQHQLPGHHELRDRPGEQQRVPLLLRQHQLEAAHFCFG